MPSLPDDSTCIVHTGERVEVKRNYLVMPDGSTRTDLRDCTLEPGAVVNVRYRLTRKPAKLAPHTVVIPAPAITPDQPPDETTATMELPSDAPKMPPAAAVDSTTVVLAVGVAGVAGYAGWRMVKTGDGVDVQQAEEQRQRKECGTRSDSVLNDFRARLADFRSRKLAMPQDDGNLWSRCDLLEGRIEQLGQIARSRTKTRRA